MTIRIKQLFCHSKFAFHLYFLGLGMFEFITGFVSLSIEVLYSTIAVF